MRRKLVVANWKMNGSAAVVEQLLPSITSSAAALKQVDVVVCPPFVYLAHVQHRLAGSKVALGAQNVAMASHGAYTGEVSASMLAESGCRYVIVGHSERRQLYGETSAVVAAKARRVLDNGMSPIVCVGETLAERDAGRTLAVVGEQLESLWQAVAFSEVAELVVAYEPVWAIGTGHTASPEQAQAVHAFLRERLCEANAVGADACLLYGGSVKADNAGELFAQPDIDGGLVGGASLKADEFTAICGAAE